MTPATSGAAVHPVRRFLRLAFALTWGPGAIGLLLQRAGMPHVMDVGSPLLLLAGYGPSLAGVICAARVGGWSGVRALLAMAVPTRQSVVWYPLILLGYPALAWLLAHALGAPVTALPPGGSAGSLLVSALLIDTGPLGEEFGWRGFALPRLLDGWSPLAAGAGLGVVWTLWHVPTFFIADLPQHALSLPLFTVSTVALSVVMSLVFVHCGRRLDTMLLLHLAANVLASHVPLRVSALTNVLCAGGLLILQRTRMRAAARESDAGG